MPYHPDQQTYEFNHPQFGRLVLEKVQEARPVRTLSVKDLPEECILTFEQVEEAALIHEHAHVQSAIGYPDGEKCAILVHISQSEAIPVKIKEMKYSGKLSGREELARATLWRRSLPASLV